MNVRTLILASAAALLVAPTALAKGPIAANISGPGDGAGGGTSVGGNGEGGNDTPLGRLVDSAGFFPATFGQQPDPMLRQRPSGDLGPRYTISYRVPGPNNEDDTIVQDVYPYARPSPVTYTRPGQPFFGTERTYGGWFVAGAELKQMIVGGDTPAAPSSDSGSASFDGPWPAVTALVLALMAAAAGLVAVRRRQASPAR